MCSKIKAMFPKIRIIFIMDQSWLLHKLNYRVIQCVNTTFISVG